jgi:hypothetical protein
MFGAAVGAAGVMLWNGLFAATEEHTSGVSQSPAQDSPPPAGYRPHRVPDSDVDGKTACLVCCDNERDTVVQPCRHLGMCWPCAATLRDGPSAKCPTCRGPMTALSHTFVS